MATEDMGLGPGEQLTPANSRASEDFDTTAKRLRFSRPIPGQSLLQPKGQDLPYERPPQFTNYEEAQEFLFDKLVGLGPELVDIISDGVPLEEIAKVVLNSGFQQGKWNVDLMLLLIEPTLYILLFICEVGALDYVFSDNEDEEFDPEEQMQIESGLRRMMKKTTSEVQADVKDDGVRSSAADALTPSLLARAEKLTPEMLEGEE